MYYLLTDTTPNCGTVVASGTAAEIWDAIDARGGIGSDRVVRCYQQHAVGDRINVDWRQAEVRDLAAECA